MPRMATDRTESQADGRCLGDDDQHQQRDHGSDHIADWTGQGGENIVAHKILEVAGVHRGRLGPANERDVGHHRHQRQHDGAHRIDMLDGVECNPAQHARRLVTQTRSHPSVCRLVKAEREQQHHKLTDIQGDLRSSHRKPDGSTAAGG